MGGLLVQRKIQGSWYQYQDEGMKSGLYNTGSMDSKSVSKKTAIGSTFLLKNYSHWISCDDQRGKKEICLLDNMKNKGLWDPVYKVSLKKMMGKEYSVHQVKREKDKAQLLDIYRVGSDSDQKMQSSIQALQRLADITKIHIWKEGGLLKRLNFQNYLCSLL